MDVRCVGVALLVIVAVCTANDALVFKAEETSWDIERDILRNMLYKPTEIAVNPLSTFRWADCGGYAGHVTFLSVAPDPIELPGTVTVAVKAAANVTMDKPIKAKVVLEKKLFGKYHRVPCVDNFGSCTYDDICAMLAPVKCPDVLVKHGINCHCPFKAGIYDLPASPFKAPKAPGVVHGEYRVTGQLYDANQKMLGCMTLELALK